MPFHNPYHFVPVKPASRIEDLKREELQANPKHVTHDRYYPDKYSGRLVCRLTTESPIFIGAERNADVSPAVSLPFELDGKPAVPASTLRGLISSITETASNSALRVLENESYSYRKTMNTYDEKHKGMSAIGMVFIDTNTEGNNEFYLSPLVLPTLDTKTMREWDAYQTHYPFPNMRVYIDNSNRENYPYDTFNLQRPVYYGLKLHSRSWGDFSFSTDSYQHIKANRFLIAQRAMTNEGLKLWEEIPEEQRSEYTRGILRILGCWGRNDIPNTKHHELFLPYPEGVEWKKIKIMDEAVKRFYDLADQRTKARNELPYEPKGTIRNLEPKNEEDHNLRLKNGDLVFFRPSFNGQSFNRF